jgi:hypothetical protein
VNPSVCLPAPTRIPRAGDERELWITDYPTALPDTNFADCHRAGGEANKGTAH